MTNMDLLTPMMKQYQEIKKDHRDAILFFRLGDFYEMFGQDAIEASKILDITLTARNKKQDAIPMCGIPYHSAEQYIARLSKAGKKVAICEQISDPSLPGIVKRKVLKIISPGTTYSEQVLNGKANNFILSIFPQRDYFGLAFADISTGEFQATEFQGIDILKAELRRINPAEITIHQDHYEHPDFRSFIAEMVEAPLSAIVLHDEASAFLRRHFKLTSLESFGLSTLPFAVQASAILLTYLRENQKDELRHLSGIKSYNVDNAMFLDEATMNNLELFSTLRGEEKEGTLLSILDETKTAMGARLLKKYIAKPLKIKLEIKSRHEAVDNFVHNDKLRTQIVENLKFLSDMERLIARISANMASPRDLLGLANSLDQIPNLKLLLQESTAKKLLSLGESLKPLDELSALIKSAISESAPVKISEGSIFKDGYNAELDELNNLMRDAKSALRRIEEQERKATGINSLKVSYNKVFGYYIELSKIHQEKAPDHYIRKQTLANAERYITPDLKDYESKILNASEKAKQLEYELFLNLREEVLLNTYEIQFNAGILAEVDLLSNFAEIALKRNFCKPELVDESVFLIVNGRHPVVEEMSKEHGFIPNDTEFIGEECNVKLITGPNMSGKSTYLRQVALIALMAQIGSFVPAEKVQMQVFDRIFTRVGASDNLVRGHSTFMVEMQESANILNHATQKSLIILDEVGRGTSTYDGLSIAWAMLEYIHDKIKGFTLFATHYHELINLAEKLQNARNFSIDVQETKTGVLFLHKIKLGGIDKSYGVEVAKLAGLPIQVTDRAEEILKDLESKKALSKLKVPENQMDIFGTLMSQSRTQGKLSHPALERLKQIKPDEMTPLEALNILNELKNFD